MKRTFMLAISIVLLGFAVVGPALATCPSDLRATISKACPCAESSKHGQFMKCVGTQLRDLKAQGCAPKDLRQLAKCANSSICGKPDKIVCCTKVNRPKLTTAVQCEAKGGQVVSGATSLCEAKCGG